MDLGDGGTALDLAKSCCFVGLGVGLWMVSYLYHDWRRLLAEPQWHDAAKEHVRHLGLAVGAGFALLVVGAAGFAYWLMTH